MANARNHEKTLEVNFENVKMRDCYYSPFSGVDPVYEMALATCLKVDIRKEKERMKGYNATH